VVQKEENKMVKAVVDPSISKGLFVIKSLASRGNSFEEISRRTGLSPDKVKRIVRKYISCNGKRPQNTSF
jgi:hypothetical protein